MFNTFLVHPIFNLLAFIYGYVHDFGVAIIILTIIVRLILWPLVTKQLHSQRALQELQPELKKIKEQAKGDRTLEGQLTMELYKEREINPFASFLPLFIQLPIFFALFIVLKDIVKPGEIAHLAYPFVKSLPAIAELISDKTAFHPTLLGIVDLTKPSVIIAVLAALAQFWQTKMLQPKHTKDDPQAQVMAGMTYLFPGFTLIIGLSWPAALSLYWTAGSAMAIIQQYIVLRRDVEELEEGVLITTPTTSTSKPKKRGKGKRKG